jgi:OmpA-OmpF porin, OOP family
MRLLYITISLFLFFISASSQDEYRVSNLGSAINTSCCELRPLISPDGKTLFFTRESHPENTMFKEYYDCQDIWFSTLKLDGKWNEAKHLTYPFNQKRYNAVFSISPDGNTMLVRTTWDKDMISIKGFGISRKTADGWAPPQWQFIQDYEQINLGIYNGAFLSNDGKTLLIYMSDQKGSEINDIFVCFLQENKKWSRPKKLPDPINTTYDEIAPFLASDGKTMYFSSDRPGGNGSNDIYVTTRLDDTWGKWSKPENLGSTINTDEWDSYYSVDASGNYAYMISYKNSFGEGDVVKVKLKDEFKPEPVVLVYGKVLNSKTKKPLTASITYEILPQGTNAGQAVSDPSTGDYKIILPYGMAYGFLANADGYISISDNMDLTKTETYKEIQRDLYLSPIEVGDIFRLNNIFFDFNKTTLRPESYPELNRLVAFMQNNSSVEIEISGHTDDVGSDEANLKLSAERARSVCEYIVTKGITASKIKTKGYGKTNPVAGNDTEEGRQLNRRVEFVIIKK